MGRASSSDRRAPYDLKLVEVIRCGNCGEEYLDGAKKKPCCSDSIPQHAGYEVSVRIPHNITMEAWEELLRTIRRRPAKGELIPSKRAPWGSKSKGKSTVLREEARQIAKELYTYFRLEGQKKGVFPQARYAMERIQDELKEVYGLDRSIETIRKWIYPYMLHGVPDPVDWTALVREQARKLYKHFEMKALKKGVSPQSSVRLYAMKTLQEKLKEIYWIDVSLETLREWIYPRKRHRDPDAGDCTT